MNKLNIKSNLELVVNEKTVVIRDYVQMRFNKIYQPFLKEIILLVVMYLFYVNTEYNTLVVACKYIVILFILRYILAIFTDIRIGKNDDDNKNKSRRYFQMNAYLILFCIILFMLNLKNYMVWLLIISYSLLVISSQEHYTSDIITTIFLVHYIYKLDLVNGITF
jgi:hypothetical protein